MIDVWNPKLPAVVQRQASGGVADVATRDISWFLRPWVDTYIILIKFWIDVKTPEKKQPRQEKGGSINAD